MKESYNGMDKESDIRNQKIEQIIQVKDDTYGCYLVNYSLKYTSIMIIPRRVVIRDTWIAMGIIVAIHINNIPLFLAVLSFKIRSIKVIWEE